jgi:hypothetical protein
MTKMLTVRQLRALLAQPGIPDDAVVCALQPNDQALPLSYVDCEIGDTGAVLETYRDPQTGQEMKLLEFSLDVVSFELECVVPHSGKVFDHETHMPRKFKDLAVGDQFQFTPSKDGFHWDQNLYCKVSRRGYALADQELRTATVGSVFVEVVLTPRTAVREKTPPRRTTKYPEDRDPVNSTAIHRLLGAHVSAVFDGPLEGSVGDGEETYRALEAELRNQGLILPGEEVDLELDQASDNEGNSAHGLYVYRTYLTAHDSNEPGRPTREFMMLIVYGDE